MFPSHKELIDNPKFSNKKKSALKRYKELFKKDKEIVDRMTEKLNLWGRIAKMPNRNIHCCIG
jgi:hypothetical protein